MNLFVEPNRECSDVSRVLKVTPPRGRFEYRTTVLSQPPATLLPESRYNRQPTFQDEEQCTRKGFLWSGRLVLSYFQFSPAPLSSVSERRWFGVHTREGRGYKMRNLRPMIHVECGFLSSNLFSRVVARPK